MLVEIPPDNRHHRRADFTLVMVTPRGTFDLSSVGGTEYIENARIQSRSLVCVVQPYRRRDAYSLSGAMGNMLIIGSYQCQKAR